MQLALPCLLYAPETCKLILKGGTNAEMAPPIDYMTDVSAEATVFFLTFASKWPEPNIIIFMHFNNKVVIVIVGYEMN